MSTFVCLMYHDVNESGNRYDVSQAAFREQLRWLADEGFTFEGFGGLERRLSGSEPLPERYVVLTIDDGLTSSLRAAELAREAGGATSVFVSRDLSRKSGYLDDAGIRELAKVADVGAHGLRHTRISFLSTEEARQELVGSRLWLEDVLSRPITTMSAPGGGIDWRVARMAREAGYRLIGTSSEARNAPSDVRRSRLVHRFPVQGDRGLARIRAVVTGDWSVLAARRLRTYGRSMSWSASKVRRAITR